MVTVVNNTITLVRGDTVEIPVTIRLRTEIFTINNGEALDAGDGDWAGDLDGHNLDEMAEQIEDAAAAIEDIQGDVSDLKEGLNSLLARVAVLEG